MEEQDRIDLADLRGSAWVRLESAAFQMGSNSGRDDARPVHDVRLAGFRISRYPVTNAQYAVFVRETGGVAPQHWPDGQMAADKSDHPVTYVSRDDAQAFCGWLTERAGAGEGAGEGGAHLPTEAQWEFAARGIEGREYPWGNDQPTPEHANYQESGIEEMNRKLLFLSSREGALREAVAGWNHAKPAASGNLRAPSRSAWPD